jgi:hypothetical protein
MPSAGFGGQVLRLDQVAEGVARRGHREAYVCQGLGKRLARLVGALLLAVELLVELPRRAAQLVEAAE